LVTRSLVCPALTLLLAFSTACSTSSHPSSPATDAGFPDAAPADAATITCTAGFQPLPDGIGCDPILPASDCPAGTMATLGSTTCAPIGNRQCPMGFVADPSGWGCTDVLPVATCVGASIEVLGQKTCQAIGSCTASFPPANATLFVSPTATVDATHFQTIGAALAAMTAGAVIAVDAGQYVESLVVTQSATLVGRCPAQVIVSNPPIDSAGLDVKGAGVTVTVTGMTFTGARPGVVAELGSNLTMKGDVVDANRDVGFLVQGQGTVANLVGTVVRGTLDPNGLGYGVAVQTGGKLTMTSSAVVGNKELGVTLTGNGSTATLTQVVVKDTQVGMIGVANGLDVEDKTDLTLTSSTVIATAGVGLAMTSGTAKVATSVIRDTASATSGTSGNGVSAISGATLSIDSSWLLRNREVSILVGGAGSTAQISNTTITDTQPNAMGQFGAGVGAESGATLTLTSSAIVKSLYYGVFLSDAMTTGEIDHTLIRDTALDHVDGIGRNIDVQDGARAVLKSTTVAGAVGEALMVSAQLAPADLDATQTVALGGHVGAFVRLGASLELVQSALLGNVEVGLYLTADDGAAKVHSKATLTDSVIRDTQPIRGDQGLGAVSGGTLTMTNVTVNRAYGGGLWVGNNGGADGGLTTQGSTATLTTCVVRDTQTEPNDAGQGHGVVGLQATVVTLLGCTLTGNSGAGIAFESATALVSGGAISNNEVGLDIQGTSTLMQLNAPPSNLNPGEVVVTADTAFTGNAQNLSSKVLPLPAVTLMQ
jgi:hypothetical protein